LGGSEHPLAVSKKSRTDGADMSRGRAILAGIVVVAVVAAAAVAVLVLHDPQPALDASLAARKPNVENGAYVARLADCAACHTTDGGKPFAGGEPFPTPVGTVYSTNITPDRRTGIGDYDLKDFIRLMRFGVARGGRYIYPAMPYTAYARATDADLADLFEFLRTEIEPVEQANKPGSAAWPLNMRWPIALWNAAFHDPRGFSPDAAHDAAWNRGAYLVQGFGHCGTCHTPRGIFFQEKDLTGRTDIYLSGSTLDNASPINLRGNSADGLGRWSKDAVAEVLKTGRSALSAVHGPMTEVVADSMQFVSDDDLFAMAVYLKSLSAAPDAGRAAFAANDDTYKSMLAGERNDAGARIYMDSCAACHRWDGAGYDHTFPRLAGNASVLAANTDSLIAIILTGNRLPSTAPAPSALAMPPFGWRYSDADIAALATFVRASWGNGGSAVTASDVSAMRKSLELGH
jgi:mono/diheme cytochrome c family protein